MTRADPEIQPTPPSGGTGLLRVANPSALLATGRRKREVQVHAGRNSCAVVYARFSRPGQRESSIARQYADADAYAVRTSLTIVRRYSDRARPGTTLVGRDGLRRLRADAKRGQFGIVIIEDVDRLARDVADLHAVAKELTGLGIEVHENKSGRVEGAVLTMKAHMAEQGRTRSLWLTREGRRDAVVDGRVPHRANYGYMPAAWCKGIHIPHPHRAGIVRELYAEAAAGRKVEDLAKRLTGREPTPADCYRDDRSKASPDAGFSRWSGNSVAVLLRNPIYMGLLVDGRTKSTTDPETLVVRQRPVDPDDWDISYVPELDLIGPELWAAAQEKLSKDNNGVRSLKGARALFRRVRCSACGHRASRFGSLRHARFTCSHEPCPGFGTIDATGAERAVLSAILGQATEAMSSAIRAGLNDHRPMPIRDQGVVLAELGRCEEELHAALMASLTGGDPDPGSPRRIAEAEARTNALQAELDGSSLVDVANPRAVTEVASAVGRLLVLAGGGHNPEDPDAKLIDAIVRGVELTPGTDGATVRVELNRDTFTTATPHPRAELLPLVLTAEISKEKGEAARRLELAERLRSTRANDRAGNISRSTSVVDQIWPTLKPLLASFGFDATVYGWDDRSFVQALVTIAWDRSHDRWAAAGLGPIVRLDEAARKAASSGLWRDALTVVETEFPSVLRGARWGWLFSQKLWLEMRGPPRDVSRRAQAQAESEAASTTDPSHAARLRAVANRLGGQSDEYVARSNGVLEVDLSAWSHLYRRHGAKALACDDRSGAPLIRRAMADLVAILADEATGPRARRNLEAVLRYLDGSTTGRIASALGMSRGQVRTVIHLFRWGGTEAFGERQRRLSDAAVDELRSIIRAGVDPDNPNEPLTYGVLARISDERFGVRGGKSSVQTRLNAAGIHLLRDRVTAPPSAIAIEQRRLAEIGLRLMRQRLADADAAGPYSNDRERAYEPGSEAPRARSRPTTRGADDDNRRTAHRHPPRHDDLLEQAI